MIRNFVNLKVPSFSKIPYFHVYCTSKMVSSQKFIKAPSLSLSPSSFTASCKNAVLESYKHSHGMLQELHMYIYHSLHINTTSYNVWKYNSEQATQQQHYLQHGKMLGRLTLVTHILLNVNDSILLHDLYLLVNLSDRYQEHISKIFFKV